MIPPLSYLSLSSSSFNVHIIRYVGYANRDSTIYKELYGIASADTVLRGTLRYQGFCDAIKGLHAMGLINSDPHPSLHPKGPEISWRQFICTLFNYPDANILLTNLRHMVTERVGSESRMFALERLGLFEDEPIQKCGSPMDTLTHLLSKRLAFQSGERDLVIMRHDIGVEWPDGEREMRNINLVVYGDEDHTNGYSAMAKCVGYPAAIAAKMVLQEEIQSKGMVVPMKSEIYHPMLKRLNDLGISAVEKITKA